MINQVGVDNHGTTLLAATGLPPHTHDDDPERGVRTAGALALTLERLGWRVAIGVTTGRALCNLLGNRVRRGYTIIGDMVNMAARLCTAGGGGEHVSVLCDAPTVEATRRRIEYGEPLELTVRGKTRPITAYRPAGRRVVATAPGTMAFGRPREHRAIRAAIESVAAGKSHAVAIQAEPGMGKSRLLSEAVSLARDRGIRCVGGAGDAIEHAGPYHAWRRVFAELLEVDDRPPMAEREQQVLRALGPARQELAPLLDVVLNLDLPDTPRTERLQNERRVQASRQFLLSLLADAAAEPLMVGIDDAHWLDSASWTLLRELLRRGPPVLTVVATRPVGTLTPEYAQLLADPATVLIELTPLATDDAVELACSRLGVATLADAVADVIVDREGGNPLFVEEIAHALRDAQLIDVVDGVCSVAAGADLRDLAMPGTVESVIANRMDGLEPRSRSSSTVPFRGPSQAVTQVDRAARLLEQTRDRQPHRLVAADQGAERHARREVEVQADRVERVPVEHRRVVAAGHPRELVGLVAHPAGEQVPEAPVEDEAAVDLVGGKELAQIRALHLRHPGDELVEHGGQQGVDVLPALGPAEVVGDVHMVGQVDIAKLLPAHVVEVLRLPHEEGPPCNLSLFSISERTRGWLDMKRMPPSSQNTPGMPGGSTDSSRPPRRGPPTTAARVDPMRRGDGFPARRADAPLRRTRARFRTATCSPFIGCGRKAVRPRKESQMDPENLRAVPLFASMDAQDLRRIATFATEDSAPTGATLMREGDYSNEMVAIESGTATVIQEGRTVASLGPGDVFGERGVLTRDLRNASVVAASPMRLVRLTNWDVKRLPQETRKRLAELVQSRQSAASTDAG